MFKNINNNSILVFYQFHYKNLVVINHNIENIYLTKLNSILPFLLITDYNFLLLLYKKIHYS